MNKINMFRLPDQIVGCKTCQRIRHATASATSAPSPSPSPSRPRPRPPWRPPRLPRRPLLPVSPEGEWISRRCETRPNSFFLRRRLAFHRNRNWSGNYSYFSDPRCSEGIFVATAHGRYMPCEVKHGSTVLVLTTTTLILQWNPVIRVIVTCKICFLYYCPN